MDLAKITLRGQITIPAEIRKKLGVKDGDKVAFIEENGRIVLENGWIAESLGDNLYIIYDKNGVPLGYIQLFNGDDINTVDIAGKLIPIDNLKPEPPAPLRSNPKTGDNLLLLLFGLLICGGILAAAQNSRNSRKKIYNKI